MIKFLAEKYYYLAAFTVLLFVLNLFKETLLNRIFGTDDFHTIEVFRNIVVYSLYICLVVLFFASIALLFAKESTVPKAVLIIVPLVVFVFLLLLYMVFGKNNMFPFL